MEHHLRRINPADAGFHFSFGKAHIKLRSGSRDARKKAAG